MLHHFQLQELNLQALKRNVANLDPTLLIKQSARETHKQSRVFINYLAEV